MKTTLVDDIKLVQTIAKGRSGDRVVTLSEDQRQQLFEMCRTLQSLLDAPIADAERTLWELRVEAHKQDVERHFGPGR